MSFSVRSYRPPGDKPSTSEVLLWTHTVAGAGLDVGYINGIVGYTKEINDSFQPDPDVIAPTCERFHRANVTFLDEMIQRSKDGTLSQRNVPERYQESNWNIAL